MTTMTQNKDLIKWVLSEVMNAYPEFAKVNVYGFKINTRDILLERLSRLDDGPRLDILMRKLYKGLEAYYKT